VDGPRFRVEQLGNQHRAAKKTFSCGVPTLDAYLQERASQDMRRGVSVAYVLWDIHVETLAGYHTLSTGSVEPTDLPGEMAGRLPRYDAIPVMLLGRLALSADDSYRGQGLGGALLVDALRRARHLSRDIGAVGVIVDAKDEQVRGFYEKHDFRRFPTQPFRLIIAMGTIDWL
jgi:GNAT superfamily N-acetyltransferase